MSKRDEVVANALWGVSHEPDIHYSQGSDRFSALNNPRQLPLNTDCSAFYTLCCKWAGVPDPNGLGYNGYGFTGTLLTHGKVISLEEALPGDAIVYGPGSGDHVVMIVDTMNQQDPIVVSHGQERGPIKIRHSVEVSSHRAPVRVLRLAGVDEGGLHMDQDVREALDAIRHEAQTAREQAAAANMIATAVKATVEHIERMVGSDIKVDNETLATFASALGQIKDDLTALRNAQAGPAKNAPTP